MSAFTEALAEVIRSSLLWEEFWRTYRAQTATPEWTSEQLDAMVEAESHAAA